MLLPCMPVSNLRSMRKHRPCMSNGSPSGDVPVSSVRSYTVAAYRFRIRAACSPILLTP